MVTSFPFPSLPFAGRWLVLALLSVGCTGESRPSGPAVQVPSQPGDTAPVAAQEGAGSRNATVGPVGRPAEGSLDSSLAGAPRPSADGEGSPGSSVEPDADGSDAAPRTGDASGEGEAEGATAKAVPIEIDRERREVRFPCRFVNPSRQIEVFACHTRGPTHETVVEFDPTGEQLYRALLGIGCRPTDRWNATSPVDFLRNQGDRVLVLVRWEWEGQVHELPAEALLLDGDTGFSSFVRGFSFSAHDVDAAAARAREARTAPDGDAAVAGGEGGAAPDGDAAVAGGEGGAAPDSDPSSAGRSLPLAVEITLGATQRERAVYSLLSHPTNLRGEPGFPGGPPTRVLQYWSFPPVVNPRALPDLQGMVERQPPATLILRRVDSEADVIRYARSIASSRGEDRRLALYESLEGVARQIDELKARYQRDVAEIEALIAKDTSAYFREGGREFGSRSEFLRRRGQWLCARIQELYFTLYYEQEDFKLAQLRSQSDLPPDILEMAADMIRDGLRYEVLIAAKERQREEGALRDLVLAQQIRAHEIERDAKWIASRREALEKRLAEFGDPDDEYVRQLLLEDVRRNEIERRAVRWRRAFNDGLIEEIAALLEGALASKEKALEARRRTAEQGLRVAKLEEDLLGADEEIRWVRNDLESDVEGRRKGAQERMRVAESRRKELEAALEKAQRELENLERESKALRDDGRR